ncbi:MAG: IS630 family transposase [Nitrososphaeraceae archaeon]
MPPNANAEFVARMEDILDVYKRPHDPNKPVICMDETSKQLLEETRIPITMKPGSPEKYDTEYERNGVCNIFIWLEPITGKYQVKVTDRRTRKDWAEFIKELVDHHSSAEKVVLIMDNLNTHTEGSLYETFEPAEARRIANKLEIHHTPKHGSWLNMAEIKLSHLSKQCLDRRIPNKETLNKEIAAWSEKQKSMAINWQFTTDDARIKLRRLYPILESGK